MKNFNWDELLFSFIRGMPENFVNDSITLAEINKYISQFKRDHELWEELTRNEIDEKLAEYGKHVEIGHSKWAEEFFAK